MNRVFSSNPDAQTTFLVFDYERVPADLNDNNTANTYFNTIESFAEVMRIRMLYMLNINKDSQNTCSGVAKDMFRQALHIHKEDGAFHVQVVKHSNKDVLDTIFTFKYDEDGFKQTGVIFP
jgi:hypothetical protein